MDGAFITDLETDEPLTFVQENFSHSRRKVIRGMHMQTNNPQGKLLKCVSGVIVDRFFDVRKDSPTFMQGCSIPLLSHRSDLLYVPPGCLHGFESLTLGTIVQYKTTTPYDKQSDGGVHYADPDMKLPWQTDRPIISDKDKNLPSLREYLEKLYG